MPGIAERLDAVRGRIAAAAARSKRDAREVTLVAISKTHPLSAIAEAAAAGQRHFGESRVQDAAEKVAGGLPEGSVFHLVGHLQSNKARIAAGLFACIHSVDGAELMLRLDAAATSPIDLLFQVDLAGEASKHGLAPERLGEVLEAARPLSLVRVRGLMCLPPYHQDPEQVRPYFRRLRELRDAHGGRERLPELSMGMSHDFEVAIEEGATLVRVGEAIFGPREPRA